VRLQDGLPLQKTSGRGTHNSVVEWLPAGPAAHWLIHIAGARQYAISARTGLDLYPPEARQRASVKHIARVLVRFRRAQFHQPSGVSGTDQDTPRGTRLRSHAQALL